MKRFPAVALALALVACSGQVNAQAVDACKVNSGAWEFAKPENKQAAMKIEQDRCKAVDDATKEWNDSYKSLSDIERNIDRAKSQKNWQEVQTIIGNAKPVFDKILKGVSEHRDILGAEDIIRQLSADGFAYLFTETGMEKPKDLDEALTQAIQLAKADGKQDKAAYIVGNLALSLKNNVQSYASGLSNNVSVAYSAIAQKEADKSFTAAMQELGAAAEQAANESHPLKRSESWLSGMGDRIGDFGAVVSWSLAAFVLALLARAGLGKAAKFAALSAVLGTLVWIVHVIVPPAVPYLGALILAICATVLGPLRLLFGLAGKPALVRLPQQTALAALVIAALTCFVVAFTLPALVVNLGAAAVALAVSWTYFPKFVTLGVPALAALAKGSGPAAGLDGLKVADGILHGSAGWGGYLNAKDGGHVTGGPEPGFALGRFEASPTGADNRFRFLGHVVTCAPTGAGKGIGAVIPNLLEYPGSALVVDFKGENYAVTARQRKGLGHAVHVVDPFAVTGAESACCNFLDRLDTGNPDCISRSATLAECLVISGKDENGHFDEMARGLLQGLMLHVAGLPDRASRHLGEVRRLLTLDDDGFLGVMADMVADPDAAYGVPARTANTLMSTGDRERGSILSTARRSTAFLDDPRIVKTLKETSFDFANMKTELVTVYLVIPPDRLEFYYRYLRGFIGTALSALIEKPVKPKYRVAFFIDEFAQLGRMQSIEKAISIVRGYGIVFWLFIQDLSQLKGAYDEKWQTFMANAAKQFFGTDDYDTAEYISKTLGKATVEYDTAGKSRKVTELVGTNSANTQYMGRELLTPDEVMRRGDKPIIIVRGEPPYRLDRLNYLTDREYRGLADPNPYHQPASA